MPLAPGTWLVSRGGRVKMEITVDLDLSVDETALLDMHSVLNILNVVIYELIQLGDELSPCPAVDELVDATVQIAATLRDPAEAHRQLLNVERYIERMEGSLSAVARSRGVEDTPSYRSRRQNLESVFNVLRIRAAELVARSADPDAWLEHPVANLEKSFQTIFHAIERNSHGGYRIVTNVAAHHEGDYLINFEVGSWKGDTGDVMRDLLANARKYTPPGGTITAGLYCDGATLRYVVQDNGRGIAPSEVETVVRFGKRGSNVTDRPTRGGGFGLTKAYYVARKFGGRMSVDSKGVPGEGTRIEIQLPLPASLGARA